MESGAEPRSVPHVGVAHETWQPGLNNNVPSTSAPPTLPSSKRPRKVTKPSRVTGRLLSGFFSPVIQVHGYTASDFWV